MQDVVEAVTCDLPIFVRKECWDLLGQIADKTARITSRDKKLKELAAQSDRGQRSVLKPTCDPFRISWGGALRHNFPIIIDNTDRNFFE